MKTALSRSSAAAGAGAAVLAQLFYKMTVDTSGVLNGAWLSAIVGLVLALPVIWLIGRLRPRSGLLAPALLVFSLLDAASAMECIGFSASWLAFTHVPVLALMLPLALATLRCTALGGDAIGASARVWMWVLAALMAVVIAYQLPYYHPAWVFPLLGDSAAEVPRMGLRAAGWIVTPVSAAMLLCDEAPRARRVLLCCAVAVAAAAALILLRLMMAPTAGELGLSRMVRIDALLTNGRAPLYLQLPMTVIWFVAMLHLLCFEGFASAALAKKCVPVLPDWTCGAAATVVVFALAAAQCFDASAVKLISDYRLPLLLLLALPCLRREARAHA